MNIAVIGAGNIGSQLARRLAGANHDVILANSRGPESLKDLAEELGARAATVADAVAAAEVVVLSIPFVAIPELGQILRDAPASTVIVEMSNYYPEAGVIEGVAEAASDTAWLSEQVGRPIIKAWSSIFSRSLALKGRTAGEPERVALPVAGDDLEAKKVVMRLVEDTGFEAVDAGSLADSWRVQPGSPAYCTDLDATALRAALARADRTRLDHDRVAMIQAVYTPETGVDMVNGVDIYREITK
ncbi:putative F420-dependent NADP oxidoreductase [Actinoplanes missouriensis 431]|uniref:Putative F420-dependent NADP oxidoreductase n=1 Tax=Actinoplanes missouriensis (strain ATCC 14538 / DSM 43046 / CBS 188.64 / JCM 3121 / NBRC 102363 / NCIMB 12654 / NRRL B-3342 / UNCC 431) TaxID=512565 RepID=I0H5R9_ACTM4|nr:NAD(P)-binding domain-containing protein [Actinoplanes missouriensis]BAL88356.1 putative F420-dependent NADP oxidoreductase [Actinoplanes missouriensis 431]